jgi:hypothetical protein
VKYTARIRRARVTQCEQRGKQRVPDVAIHVAAKRLEVPTYAEGFDDLYQVRLFSQSDYDITAMRA